MKLPKIPKPNLTRAKDAAVRTLAKVPRPRKRDLAAVAVGVALGAGGMAVQPDDPIASMIEIAPVHMNEGDPSDLMGKSSVFVPGEDPMGPHPEKPCALKSSDTDEDCIANTDDHCPWNKGSAKKRGCP